MCFIGRKVGGSMALSGTCRHPRISSALRSIFLPDIIVCACADTYSVSISCTLSRWKLRRRNRIILIWRECEDSTYFVLPRVKTYYRVFVNFSKADDVDIFSALVTSALSMFVLSLASLLGTALFLTETSCGQIGKTRESLSGFCYCLSNNFKTLSLHNFIIRGTKIICP